MMYGELSLFQSRERLRDTLQRLDFIIFDLVPTMSLPFYLAYVVALFGGDAFVVSRRNLSPAALDIVFQHGAGVPRVRPIHQHVCALVVADLSVLPRRLPQVRALLLVFVGNHLRHIAA